MRLREWFRARWPTIRDNAVYDLIKAAFLALLGAATYWIMRYALPAATALTLDEVKLVAIMTTLLMITAAAVTWVFATTSLPRIGTWRGATTPLGVPTRLSLPRPPGDLGLLTPVPNAADLVIEIREILFQRTHFSILGPSTEGCFILMSVKAINRTSDDVLFTDEWKLDVAFGEETRTAVVAAIPTAWIVRRPSRGIGEDAVEEIRPNLEETGRIDGLRKATPMTGWVLFQLSTWDNIVPPYGARFTLHVRDSMGRTYSVAKPPAWYKETGEIVARPNSGHDKR